MTSRYYNSGESPLDILTRLIAPPDANLSAFYASNPAYDAEYQRVRTLGDKRDPLVWFQDFLTASPQDEAKYTSFRPIADTGVTAPAAGGSGFTDMIAAVFNTPGVANPDVTAPASVTGNNVATGNPSIIDRFLNPPPAADNTGVFTQIIDMLGGLLGLANKPSSNLTVAPVTNTSVDNRAWVDNSTTVNDSSVHNSGFSLDSITSFMARLPSLLSTPRGNDIVSPSPYMGGYAQNLLQSGQRQSDQTVASITGFDLNASGVQIGSTAIPWRTLLLGALISLGLFILYRKFFK